MSVCLTFSGMNVCRQTDALADIRREICGNVPCNSKQRAPKSPIIYPKGPCRRFHAARDKFWTAMATIPDLTAYRLIHCTMCALVDGGIEHREMVELHIRHAESKQFLVAFDHLSQEKSDQTYLHIEMALAEWFDGSLPKRSGTRKSFDERIESN